MAAILSRPNVLNAIHETYVARGKGNIYLAFSDFSEFFDTINREMLCYKLLKYGISRPVYNVIKNMYSATRYRVKIRDIISSLVLATSGVKQGCPLQQSVEKVKTYCYKWGLVVDTENNNNKSMVLSKQTYAPVCFRYGGMELQAAESINYPFFFISYNGKYHNLINDRVMKANWCPIWYSKHWNQIRMCLFLTNRWRPSFFMDVPFGHYQIHRILYIW